MDNMVSEETILDALRRVPEDRWNAVLQFLKTLENPSPIRSSRDLLQSDLIGLLAYREDNWANTDLKGRNYLIHVYHDGLVGTNTVDDNVDVEVRFDDGSRYAASFFTLTNLHRLFEKCEGSGENKSGLYLWSSDMVIVKELTEATISETVADLISEGGLEGPFSKLSESLDDHDGI